MLQPYSTIGMQLSQPYTDMLYYYAVRYKMYYTMLQSFERIYYTVVQNVINICHDLVQYVTTTAYNHFLVACIMLQPDVELWYSTGIYVIITFYYCTLYVITVT